MPIASPRRRAGNQPMTTRPLAALVEAAAIPVRTRKSPSTRSVPPEPREEPWRLADAMAAPVAAAAVSSRPPASTQRSPYLSVTAPQATRVSTMPKVGSAASRPARARSRPSSAWKNGMSGAGVVTTRVPDACAATPMPSMSQGRGCAEPRDGGGTRDPVAVRDPAFDSTAVIRELYGMPKWYTKSQSTI